MNELCRIIRETVTPNFMNIRTSIQTYDRDALCFVEIRISRESSPDGTELPEPGAVIRVID